MKKPIPILILGIVLVNFISATYPLEISQKLHCFKEGKEIIPTSDVECSSIAFEIIGKNNLENSRIMELHITDAYPLSFKKSLPEDITSELRIKQTKTLFISQIIHTNQFNKTNISLWVGVEGILEKTGENLYVEKHFNLTLNEPQEESTFVSFGNILWEDNPGGGIMLLTILGCVMIYFLWYFRGRDKIGKWRDEREIEREERRQEEG